MFNANINNIITSIVLGNDYKNLNNKLIQESPRVFNNHIENGITSFQQVYDENDITQFNNELNKLLSKHSVYSHLNKTIDVQTEHIYVNNTYTLMTNNTKMKYFHLPVIENKYRENHITNKGVIIIHNINKLMPDFDKYFNIEFIQQIMMQLTNTAYIVDSINLHFYNNCSNPDEFKYNNEGISGAYNYVVYLNNITEYNGCQVYIKNTHLYKTNMKNDDILYFNLNKGDILVYSTYGFNRVLPNTGINAFLIFSLKPI